VRSEQQEHEATLSSAGSNLAACVTSTLHTMGRGLRRSPAWRHVDQNGAEQRQRDADAAEMKYFQAASSASWVR